MNSRYINIFRTVFACCDLLTINGVYLILVSNMHRIPGGAGDKYQVLYAVANMLWLIAAYVSGLYTANNHPSWEDLARKTLRCLLAFYGSIALFMFLYHFTFSRLFVVCWLAAFGLIVFGVRVILLLVASYLSRSGHIAKRVVIVGYNDVAVQLAEMFSQQDRSLQVEGYFEDSHRVHELSRFPIIGDINECLSYAINNNVNEIYSTISPEQDRSIYEMAHVAERSLIRFKFVPDLKLYVNRNTHMEYMGQLPVLSLRPEPLADDSNAVRKRAFDIVFSLIVIVFILSWLVPLMAILIKLSSPGPVFFVQLRSGKDNKQFRCYKFRTLSVNNDAHVKQVTKDDKRITPLGRFLRKSNLDELPQFFNVLLGDMSVVGPRPHMLAHTEMFSKAMEEYMVRHFVKPGVTGWAQVNGYRGEIKENAQLHQRIRHDIWYMENWSLWLDVRIILLTVYLSVKGDKNAY